MFHLNRRDVIGAALAGSAVSMQGAMASPTDWRSHFDVTSEVIQLENGNFGTMPRAVAEAYKRHIEDVNRRGSYYARREAAGDFVRLRAHAAAVLGVGTDEIAFTRGATEALQVLIGGYNRLRPGDAVLIADLDYDSTQAEFRALVQRRGVTLVSIDLPEPATHQALIDAYEAALKANPKIRLMLLTHVSHRTGLVLPVAEISAMARAHGADVIVDTAHGWGQLDFKLGDLGADFVGLTCQKWIGAPLGTGIVYIRRERLDAIDPFFGELGEGIDHKIHTGTTNIAAFLAVGDALDFHTTIGAVAKEARLRGLRDRWAEALRDHPRIEILTPADPRLTCGITSFRLKGQTEAAQNRAIAEQLLKQFNIFTVERSGIARGACVRVTPGLFTSEAEIDALVTALKAIA